MNQITSQSIVKSARNVVLVATLAVASAFTMSAVASDGHERHGERGGHMGMMDGGMHGGMHGRMMERMLDRVKATPEQRTQIKQITDAAAADIKKQREANAGMHQQAMKVFTAPTVDANAVEQLRQQRMAQHDQASRRMSQAMLDISRVLTPDQRAQIAAQMAKRGERRGEGGHKH